MPRYKVDIKWGKESFKGVEANTDEEPALFKAQVFALTGVLPERQKLMLKGAILKDDAWGNLKLSDNVTFMLMGTKEEDMDKAPIVKSKFMEDMDDNELAVALDLPSGLMNLGNTCYMNATIQCLKSVPELIEALNQDNRLTDANANPYATSITAELKHLFTQMEMGPSIPPLLFMTILHKAIPAFAEKDTGGTYMQQDANEFWTELIRMLQAKIPALANKEGCASAYRSFIEQFFGGKLKVTLKCKETEDEPVVVSHEEFLQLSCFISTEVKYMVNGLKSKMVEQITKRSDVLDRDAVFVKKAEISRLPAYLTVQFVRFFYKEKEKLNAKILKDVKFPVDFDAYELCCEELRRKMDPIREKFKKVDDLTLEKKMNSDEEKKEVKYEDEPYAFPDDYGSNNSGYYTLQAVLTHKGRSSSSGHYVGWVKYKDSWLKCDDDDMTPVSLEDVLKLSGGGDWHCAYVLLYGPKVLKIPDYAKDELQ